MVRKTRLPKQITNNDMVKWAREIPDMLIQDANWHNQIMLQWLSESPGNRWEIDGEIGKMENDLLVADTDAKGLISYVRYDQWLDGKNLNELMAKTYSQKQLDEFADISNVCHRYELYDYGYKAAVKEVDETHFPGNFRVSATA